MFRAELGPKVVLTGFKVLNTLKKKKRLLSSSVGFFKIMEHVRKFAISICKKYLIKKN